MDLDIATTAQHTPAPAPTLRNTSKLDSPAVPIASLTPVQPVPSAASLHAVVALIYPYSSATGTLALLLTEPDFRLRLRRGQVRVQFRGQAARAVAGAKVGIGDAVSLDLKGGKWVESSGVGTPGRGVEGELVFQNFVQLEVEREGEKVASIELDQRDDAQVKDIEAPGDATTPMQNRIRIVEENTEHASPAFWRGKRVTSGGFSVVAVDPFADVASRDEYTPSKRRKSWRFIQQSESPETEESQTLSQQQSATPVVVMDEGTEPQIQGVFASSPTPAPPASRRDPILAPLDTTNLQPQPQMTQPLSTPTFKIPSTPPAPPALRPVQSPALPLVSPFTSMPPPELRDILAGGEQTSPLPVTSAGISIGYSSVTAADQDFHRPAEAEDYFAYPSQEQQSQKDPLDVQPTDFVEFEHDKIAAPPSIAPSARHDVELMDLSGETGTSRPDYTPHQTADTVPLVEVDQFFDFAAATQIPVSQQQDQTAQSVNVTETQEPVLQKDLEQSQVDKHQELASMRGPQAIGPDGALPSPMHEGSTSQDDRREHVDAAHISSQFPTEIHSQDTVHTSIPVPMLPTPATSQNRLLEMVRDAQDTMDVDKEPVSTQDVIREKVKDSHEIEPITPTIPTKRMQLSDVPAILSPWFSSRRSSKNKSVENQMSVTEDVKRSSHEGQVPLATQTRQGFEQQLNKVANGLRTRLAYFTPLASLQVHLNASSQHTGRVDILAIVSTASSVPKRAKGGPRDYFTIFHVADQTLSSDPVQVQVLRPYKASLPIVERGDVVLLRNFVVKSVKRVCILLSGEASSWCAWRIGGGNEDDSSQQDDFNRAFSPDLESIAAKEEVKGPPVEIEDEERTRVLALRFWWSANRAGIPDRIK